MELRDQTFTHELVFVLELGFWLEFHIIGAFIERLVHGGKGYLEEDNPMLNKVQMEFRRVQIE